VKAWQVQGHGEPTAALHIVDTDLPEPGPGQVRLRVRAAALGFPDVLMCRGIYPLTPALPFTPGQEVAGVVTAVGVGVDHAVGDRIMAVTAFDTGRGGFAEEALARAGHPIPDSMSDADAAGFYIAYITGWIGLVTRGQMQPGETLAVLGAAGGCGSAAVQLAKVLGARVIAVVGGDEKAEYCRSIGADEIVDHTRENVPEMLRALTNGRGADLIYDPVGGSAATDALRGIASEGRMLGVGFASGEWPELNMARIVIGNYTVMGVYVGAYSGGTATRDAVERLNELFATGAISSGVTNAVTFDELPAALERLADRTAMGKTVVVM
jgi:NADPH2:quinone reductase